MKLPTAITPQRGGTGSSPRTYRPAAVLRLSMRLEDFNEGLDDEAQSEDEPFQVRKAQILDTLAKINSNLADVQAGRNLGAARFSAGAPASSGDVKKLIMAKLRLERQLETIKDGRFADDTTTVESGGPFNVVFYSVPIDLQCELNSFRIADTLKASIPFKDAPIPEDLVRACLVEAYLGTVPAGSTGDPNTWRIPVDSTTLIFRGYADNWADKHSESDATIEIDARSLDAILMDAKVFATGASRLLKGSGLPITQFVNDLLTALPQTSGELGGVALTCVLDPKTRIALSTQFPDTDGEPVISRKTLNRALQTAKSRNKAAGAQNGVAPPVAAAPPVEGSTQPGQIEGTGDVRVPPPSMQPDTTAWEVIVAAVEKVGLLPIYDSLLNPDQLVLKSPLTLFEKPDGGVTFPLGPPDQFNRPITDPSSGKKVRSEVRFMVWGHNIKSFTRKRKLGRITAPAIQVISMNPGAAPKERVLEVRFPKGKRGTHVQAGTPTKGSSKLKTSSGKIDTVYTKIVAGVRNIDELERIAQGMYESMARQETSVRIETDDMASFIDLNSPLAHNENPDLLQLRPGTPVRVMVARKQENESLGLVITPLSDLFNVTGETLTRTLLGQKGRFLRGVSGDEHVRLATAQAQKIANAIRQARFTDLFYTRTVAHKWSITEGWAAEMELVNYIESRSSPDRLTREDKRVLEEMKANQIAAKNAGLEL